MGDSTKPKKSRRTGKPVGRPSDYSPELVDRICEQLMLGRSLLRVCRDDDWAPGYASVAKWLSQHADFREKYARAREAQADYIAAETQEIADDARNDWMEGNAKDAPGWALNGEHVQRSRLRIDQRKWFASKLFPKKYGDKIEHSGEIAVGELSDIQRAARILAIVERARKAKEDGEAEE